MDGGGDSYTSSTQGLDQCKLQQIDTGESDWLGRVELDLISQSVVPGELDAILAGVGDGSQPRHIRTGEPEWVKEMDSALIDELRGFVEFV